MRSFKLFLLTLVMGVGLLLVASPAFALQCKTGNYGSDECWTEVKLSASETVLPATIGSALVYDFASSPDADTSAFQVRIATASTDSYRVAGISQTIISTGDRGMVLVRGKGKVQVSTAVTSGDRLYTTTDTSCRGCLGPQAAPGSGVASHDKVVAFALQTVTAKATIDAFIVVV